MLQQHQLPDSDQYDQYGEKMLNISGVWSLSFVVVNSFGTMFAQTKSLMCELVCKINCRFLVAPPLFKSLHQVGGKTGDQTTRPNGAAITAHLLPFPTPTNNRP